jgi:hypothetical protein
MPKEFEQKSLGSGFIIDKNGYILTNQHVISETLEGHLWGEDREINVTIVSLKVVVEAGTMAERELLAKVVDQDRRRDLALLKVGYKPAFYLEPRPGKQVMPNLTDEVITIGFPFGNLLALDDSGSPSLSGNPEPTVSTGRVTSIRRDAEQETVAVQTDSIINPGCSGGPMLSSRFELIGVVYAGIAGGTEVGFAIAPNRVWDFIVQQEIKVRFRPPYVYDTGTPITVLVSEGMYPLHARRGIFRLQGRDIETTEVDLEQTTDGWQGTLDVPDFIVGQPRAELYVATIRMYGSGRRVVFENSYRIERRRADAAVLAQGRSPGATLRDRSILANQLSIRDYARRQASQREAERTSTMETEAPAEVDQQLRHAVPVSSAAELERDGPPIPETSAELTERARDLLKEDDAIAAIELLERALLLDPENVLATGFLDLARAQAGELATGGSEPAAQPPATTVADEPQEMVDLLVKFQSSIQEGKVELILDDAPFQEIAFDFKKGSMLLKEVLQVPAGRHTLKVCLYAGGDLLGEKSFSEYLDVETAWTLRINLHSKDSTPGFFLVMQR